MAAAVGDSRWRTPPPRHGILWMAMQGSDMLNEDPVRSLEALAARLEDDLTDAWAPAYGSLKYEKHNGASWAMADRLVIVRPVELWEMVRYVVKYHKPWQGLQFKCLFTKKYIYQIERHPHRLMGFGWMALPRYKAYLTSLFGVLPGGDNHD